MSSGALRVLLGAGTPRPRVWGVERPVVEPRRPRRAPQRRPATGPARPRGRSTAGPARAPAPARRRSRDCRRCRRPRPPAAPRARRETGRRASPPEARTRGRPPGTDRRRAAAGRTAARRAGAHEDRRPLPRARREPTSRPARAPPGPRRSTTLRPVARVRSVGGIATIQASVPGPLDSDDGLEFVGIYVRLFAKTDSGQLAIDPQPQTYLSAIPQRALREPAGGGGRRPAARPGVPASRDRRPHASAVARRHRGPASDVQHRDRCRDAPVAGVRAADGRRAAAGAGAGGRVVRQRPRRTRGDGNGHR